MTKRGEINPKDCPHAEYHGNPFRYCDICMWTERDDDSPTATQWRAAANVLREHAAKFDSLAEEANRSICGVILPNAGPNGESVACALLHNHLPSPHSWAWLPTVGQSS